MVAGDIKGSAFEAYVGSRPILWYAYTIWFDFFPWSLLLPSSLILLWKQRPFRHPHHTSSGVALVGGGSIPSPGEISIAHQGVLFLDELPEFKRHTLEVLREPMETGTITVSRAAKQAEFPARFQLIAAMNP